MTASSRSITSTSTADGTPGAASEVVAEPFPAKNLLAHVHALEHEQPALPSTLREGVPAELDGVVLRLLAKSPSERYASAAEAEQGLLGCLESPGI